MGNGRYSVSEVCQIILVLVPLSGAFGYAMAYLHEMGFCGYFGIPFQLIMIDWTTVVIAIAANFSVISILYFTIDAFFIYINDLKSEQPHKLILGTIRRRLIYLSLFIVMFVIVFAVSSLARQQWDYVWPGILILFLFLVWLYFVAPIRAFKDVSGYRNKLKAQDEKDRKTRALLSWLADFIGWSSTLILLVAVFVLVLSFLVGDSTARDQEYFFVPSTNQQSVILRIYGDKLICTPIIGKNDKDQFEVTRNFFVLRLDEPKLNITLVKLSKLIPR